MMLTYKGKDFNPDTFSVTDVDMHDISHALSMQCRYNGHCSKFYSVAEHSVYVYNVLYGKGANLETQMYGLLHDAAEAYLSDIPTPLKVKLPLYQEWETRIFNVIIEKVTHMIGYDGEFVPDWLTQVDLDLVHRIDRSMVPYEMAQMFDVNSRELVFDKVTIIDLNTIKLANLRPGDAKASFETSFKELLTELKYNYAQIEQNKKTKVEV